ncbi:hypothetical protein STEG23_016442 [Scotinomys teguina]
MKTRCRSYRSCEAEAEALKLLWKATRRLLGHGLKGTESLYKLPVTTLGVQDQGPSSQSGEAFGRNKEHISIVESFCVALLFKLTRIDRVPYELCFSIM